MPQDQKMQPISFNSASPGRRPASPRRLALAPTKHGECSGLDMVPKKSLMTWCSPQRIAQALMETKTKKGACFT